MKYTLKQILEDKQGALNEKIQSTETKNKKGYHVATKQAVSGDMVRAVANTFNFFDYDADVLTPDSTTETLKDRDIPVYHLKNHKFDTDGLIGAIKQIGVEEIETEEFGKTPALTFESETTDFEWYKKGVISQHSIGFRYEDIRLAVREGGSSDEEKLFAQYIDQIINKDEALEAGYYYLVSKINLYEVSAVLRGANRLTSTLKAKDLNSEKSAIEILNRLNFA